MLLEHDGQAGAFAIQPGFSNPAMRRHQSGDHEIYLSGHPIVAGQRDDTAVICAFAAAKDIEGFARELDGNFLVVVRRPKSRSVQIISDRFASHGFYFSENAGGSLIGSRSLVSLLRRLGGLVPDERAFIEFLHFRRIFGDKTYDRRCTFLASASILEHGPNGASVRKYWQPDYAKPKLNTHSASDAIINGLRGTMRAHMEGEGAGRRYALFMSGGLDSRALLASAAAKLLCVTTCGSRNNEADVAEQAARTAGAEFLFVPRPDRPYDGHVDDAIVSGGGQHVLIEAHFIAYGPLVQSRADCFFLGLGLDVFLGGLYLPKHPANWLGRDALHYHLAPPGADVAAAFIDGVKYRLSTSDPWAVVKSATRRGLRDGLHHSIGEVAAHGQALGASGYDLWEYLHLHNFGRHYSFLMMESVRRWAECRAPGLCNDLLDIAIALPAELKANSTAYLAALNRLSPELMRIRNANTNVAAGLSFERQSLVRAARIAANKFGGRFRVSPAAADRSWPAPAEILHVSLELRDAVQALPQSTALDSLGFLDRDAIRNTVDNQLAGRGDDAMLLLMLVTIDGFLRQVR